MDESFPAKRFKSNKLINRATSGSEAALHICEQFVGFKIPDKSTVDHSFHMKMVTSGTKMEGERIYKACLRYLPILHNFFLFCTDNSCTSFKTEGLDE